jgi:hypothetical protein
MWVPSACCFRSKCGVIDGDVDEVGRIKSFFDDSSDRDDARSDCKLFGVGREAL